MGRSKFPGKPSKLVNKKRVSVLQGSENSSAPDDVDENADYLLGDQVSFWNSRNETTTFGHDGAVQNTFVPQPREKPPSSEPPDGGGRKLFQSVVKIDKPFNSGISSRTRTSAPTSTAISSLSSSSSSSSNTTTNDTNNKGKSQDKPKKKTVTFKNILETSDDASAVKKVYNPDNAPLVPIIKRECLSRSVRLARSDCIVRPSRLTEILKNNSNNIDKLNSLTFKTTSPASTSPSLSSPSSSNRMETNVPCLQSSSSSSSPAAAIASEAATTTTANNEDESNESSSLKKLDKSEKSQNDSVVVGDKRFVLPKRSVHSCRVIKPNKRFLDDMDTTVKNIKKTNISNNKKTIKNQSRDDDDEVDLKCQKQKSAQQESSFINNTLSTQIDSNRLNDDETSEKPAVLIETSQPVTDDTQSDSTDNESDSLTDKKITFSSPTKSTGLFSSSKFVLRQPRLQFDFQTKSPFSASINNAFALNPNKLENSIGSTGNPTTCGVCGSACSIGQKSKTFDIFSCDACRKFITKTIKKIVNSSSGDSHLSVLQCLKNEGGCTISAVPGNKAKNIKRMLKERCHACWLKKCLRSFNVSSRVRKLVMARLPATLFETENSPSPFSCKENVASTDSKSNLTGNLFAAAAAAVASPSNACSTNLSNWSENADSSNSAQLPSNALVENNATFGSSPLIRPTVLEKRVFTAAASNTDSDKKNVLDGTKSVINANDSKTAPVNDDENAKSKQKRNTVLQPVTPPATVASPTSLSAPMPAGASAANDATPKRQRIDLKGPRVKHVCRSASIVLGQPIATFPSEEDSPLEEIATTIITTTTTTTTAAISPRPESPNNDEGEISQSTVNSEPSISCTNCGNSEPEIALSPPPSMPSEEEITESSENAKKIIDIQRPPTRKITRAVVSKKPASQNDNENLPAVISIDFWENYDPAEVSQTGFGLILTESLSIRALCFLCGSAGCDPFLFCACCCEPYHQYCVEDEYNLKHSSLDDTMTSLLDSTLNVGANLNLITNRLNWLCPRCTVCYTCNMSSGSKVKCQKCQKNYHTTCLGTSKRLLGADRPLICANCLKCKSCATTKVTKFVGNLPMCSQCFKLRKKGNYCPVCQKCYEDNDFDLKMMECGDCERWVHAKCEGLSDEQYNMLSTLPENIEFICKKCSKSNVQATVWRDAVAAEFKSGLLGVVKMLSKSRQACALLKLSPRKKTVNCICQPIQANRNIQFGEPESDYKMIDDESQNSDDTALEDIYDFKETSPTKKCFCGASDRQSPSSPTLIDIKRKINACEYVSVAEFNYDMMNVISAANCDELIITYKEIVSETFPWFQNETKACTDLLEEDMFDSCSFTQNNEIECDQQVPVIDLPEDIDDYFFNATGERDDRSCMLCKGIGEGESNEESRLIYCGHNVWVHINCAMWSAEVFEEIDGSLQNVHSAISRGRLIKCTHCENRGATVGCNIKSCGEHYHYPCARKAKCGFMTDKTVYCPHHINEGAKKKFVDVEGDFSVQRPVYVELDRKKKRMAEPSKVQFLIGSLVVKKLGNIYPKFSDTNESLLPVDFLCTRLYWSIKEPWKIVEYTVKTSIQNGVLTLATDYGRNYTVDHMNSGNVVQLGLAQIARWHNSLMLGDENDIRQERNRKQLLEAVSQNYNNDDATEEEPQNNADLLPPEIKDAIFEDLPHELLDGISMLDIFPKLMIYEDMLTLDSKAEALFSNEFAKDNSMSEEDGNDSQKDAEIGSSWSMNTGFSHVEDALLSAVRPISNSREIKRSKSEVFTRTIGNNRSQQRSSSLTFSCKLDGTAAKRRKLSKGFQDTHNIRIPESVLLSIGRRKDELPTIDRHRSSQNDDIKTKTFNWSAAKKYSTTLETNGIQDGASISRDIIDKFKISQLDGMDDLLSENEMAEYNQMQNVYDQNLTECPVKCDRCNCTYRTHESYQRHLATCEPLSTSESESESARSPPITTHNIVLSTDMHGFTNGNYQSHPQSISIVQNMNQSSLNTITSPHISTSNAIPISCNSTTQNIQIQSLQSNGIPITQLNQSLSNIILANAAHQQQQQTQPHAAQFIPFNAAQLIQSKNEVPTASVSTIQTQPQIFTMPASNGTQVVTISSQQQPQVISHTSAAPMHSIIASQQQKMFRAQNERLKPKPIQRALQSPTSKIKPKTNNANKAIQMKKIVQRTETRPMSVMNENLQSTGLILQQNPGNTQPIIVQQVTNNPHNLVSYVTDNHGQPMQYLAVPSANDFKPQQQNTFLTPNPLMQGTFLQTDSSGNILLTNASTGLQMLSAPLQLAQQHQPQVIGTLIQPQSGAMQCGVMSAEQMMLGAAPTLEMVTNPTMLLASQPVYYGLETIVQNTVMSSQQFVSTAMQGVLSQNASFSATTTQVFQASKIEPIMEVPSGYVVLNNVDGTLMQQQTTPSNILSANVLQQPLAQLQPQSQQIHAQMQPQQINTQQIYNIQQHHVPQSQTPCIVPQQIHQAHKHNTLSPAKPTGKTTPIMVTKIQPQIINKVVPSLTVTSNQQHYMHDNIISTVLTKPATVTTDSYITTVQSPKVAKAAPLAVSQQYTLKPKVSAASVNVSSSNMLPQQRKMNMIRPLTKTSSVTIKPKLLSKSMSAKNNHHPKSMAQTPALIAPKPQFTMQCSTNAQNLKPITVDNIDKSVPLQFNITLVDPTLSEQNQTSQPVTISPEKACVTVSASFAPIVDTNLPHQQSNNLQQYNANCTVSPSQPITLHASSIQLPSAPFNSPYANNIPTNIVNPIQQTANVQGTPTTISRPTNRVLPMQTIQPKNSPPASEQKIPDLNKEIQEDKDLKNAVSNTSSLLLPPMKLEISAKFVENIDMTVSEIQSEFSKLKESESLPPPPPLPKSDEESKEKDQIMSSIMDEDFDMKTNCDDITDNDDRSESTIPEVKEKICKILENLDDECNKIEVNFDDEKVDEALDDDGDDDDDDEYLVEQKENVDPRDSNDLCKMEILPRKIEQPAAPKPNGPHVLYEIQSEDGFIYKSTSITEIWEKVFEAVQIARKAHGLLPLPEGPLTDMCGIQMLGLKTNALRYLVEQLPGTERCNKYTPKYHKREKIYSTEYSSDQEDLKENAYGAIRCEPFLKRSDYDMFSWLASRHRKQPVHVVIQPSDNELIPRRGTGSNLPMAMKYRTLKETYKDYVGVFRSHIHGRGLYCTKDIESGEMVIEYAGELIRSTLTDKRERYYDSKNIGCYMFKIDDNLVVDATMRGNAARFINHSCEPNCYSKVVDILGHKHIIIFALRRIVQGEELTYDYKFPFEDDKIPCSCRSRKCRKYLN